MFSGACRSVSVWDVTKQTITRVYSVLNRIKLRMGLLQIVGHSRESVQASQSRGMNFWPPVSSPTQTRHMLFRSPTPTHVCHFTKVPPLRFSLFPWEKFSNTAIPTNAPKKTFTLQKLIIAVNRPLQPNLGAGLCSAFLLFESVILGCGGSNSFFACQVSLIFVLFRLFQKEMAGWGMLAKSDSLKLEEQSVDVSSVWTVC